MNGRQKAVMSTDKYDFTKNDDKSNQEKIQKLYKRTLIIIVISQIFGGAGLAAGITVGALLAEQMLGTDAFAGLPADRKSTRLNSSHVATPYAVSCSNKKKQLLT